MKRVIVALMAAALLMAGTACSPAGETEPSSQEVSSSSSSSASPVPQEEGHGVAEHGAAARYYEYLKDHSEVCLLLSPEGQPFTDEQLSAYALWVLAVADEEGDGFETGFSPEEMNAAAEKYTGRTIREFDNQMTYLDPQTGTVKPTGWGLTSIRWVLSELTEEPDGSRTGLFYYFVFSLDADLPAPDRMERQLLAGEFESYGVPYLARMHFREQWDEETGEFYLQILSLEELGDGETPYTVYGS